MTTAFQKISHLFLLMSFSECSLTSPVSPRKTKLAINKWVLLLVVVLFIRGSQPRYVCLLAFAHLFANGWRSARRALLIRSCSVVQEICLSDPPVVMTLVDGPTGENDNLICVAYRHQFDLINESTGESYRLHHVETSRVSPQGL